MKKYYLCDGRMKETTPDIDKYAGQRYVKLEDYEVLKKKLDAAKKKLKAVPPVDTSDKRVDAETQPESRPFNETIDRAEANGVLMLRDNQWMFWAQYGFLTPTELRTIANELEMRDRGQG